MKNFDKVVVLTQDDRYVSLSDWQKSYGLEIGSAAIGKHFNFTEPKFAEDIGRYGKLIVCAPLMMVLDRYRELIGEPVNINSFNRDERKQEELREAGARAAMTSPHVEKMAADVDTVSKEETTAHAEKMLQAGRETGIPVRVGFRDYLEQGQTFIHVDVCPLYYSEGGPRHQEPHPTVWERKFLTW